MRGGFLVAHDNGLYNRATQALATIGAAFATDDFGGMVQFTDDSARLFTLYEHVPEGADWEVREGLFIPAPGVQPPDMQRVTACPFECRWPDLVAVLADVIAQTAEVPTWVLDGDGVIWDAKAVDPLKVQL